MGSQLRNLAPRFLQGLGVLLFLTIVTFIASHLTGDPRNVILSPDTPKVQYDEIGRQLGLNRSLPVQYGIYMERLFQGDFGTSIFWQRSVTSVIGSRLGNTLGLGAFALVLTVLVSVPMAVLAALHRGSAWDSVVRTISLIGQSAPTFWVGLILIQIFAVDLGWLPIGGYSGTGLAPYVLPALTLTLYQTASIVRLLRSAIVNELDSSYVLMARIKGLSQRRIVWQHVLRNASGPALSYAGVEFIRAFLTGSIIVETVFAWPGVGQLVFRSVESRDFPVIQASVLLFGLMYVVASLLVDIAQGYLDPRLRTV